jgi:DNA-binding MarR family transcriptional regulator
MIKFESRFPNDSEKSLGFLFIRAYNAWHGKIKKELATVGITHPQFVVLTSCNYLLYQKKNVTQALLSQITEIDKVTLSQIITLLEKKEFLKREKSEGDQRANSIILTKQGEEMVRQALPKVEKVDEEFFEILGKDKEHFRNSIRTLLSTK